MPKVILKGFILVPEEELETVKSALPIHMRLTKRRGWVPCVSSGGKP